jgi:Glycosidases
VGGDDGTAADLTAGEDSFTVDHPYHPPEWPSDAVVYEVYVRTFAGDDPDESGDTDQTAFGRIRERLDHLVEMGVDVLWLTPVLENDHAPHGYNITDFFQIAADLGGREAYEQLIDAAHDRGLRVVFDLVLNHSARAHPYFLDAYGEGTDVGVGQGSPNPESEYHDWYDWRADGEPETYFEWEHIANFDFDTLAVRRHLLDAVDEWASLVDGFRCDMAWAVPNGFWREIHDRVKRRRRILAARRDDPVHPRVPGRVVRHPLRLDDRLPTPGDRCRRRARGVRARRRRGAPPDRLPGVLLVHVVPREPRREPVRTEVRAAGDARGRRRARHPPRDADVVRRPGDRPTRPP